MSKPKIYIFTCDHVAKIGDSQNKHTTKEGSIIILSGEKELCHCVWENDYFQIHVNEMDNLLKSGTIIDYPEPTTKSDDLTGVELDIALKELTVDKAKIKKLTADNSELVNLLATSNYKGKQDTDKIEEQETVIEALLLEICTSGIIQSDPSPKQHVEAKCKHNGDGYYTVTLGGKNTEPVKCVPEKGLTQVGNECNGTPIMVEDPEKYWKDRCYSIHGVVREKDGEIFKLNAQIGVQKHQIQLAEVAAKREIERELATTERRKKKDAGTTIKRHPYAGAIDSLLPTVAFILSLLAIAFAVSAYNQITQ